MASKTCQQWEAEWLEWLENAEHDSISEESTISNFEQEIDEDTDARLAFLKQEQSAYVKDWNKRMAKQYGAGHERSIVDDIEYRDFAHRGEDLTARRAKKKDILAKQLASWKEKSNA